MYLMMIEVHKMMFKEYRQKGYKYIMYDTFFGASEGLKKFKEKLGYKPYKVRWIWENQKLLKIGYIVIILCHQDLMNMKK